LIEGPTLVVFGGPNGSGKSTLIEGYRKLAGFPNEYVNADEMARENSIGAIEAAQAATRRRASLLRSNTSFAMETVMSMPDKIQLLRKAKLKGYYIHLVYVTTQDPQINVWRVEDRVRKGGHDVPPEKIRQRYFRSMNLLSEALIIVDSAEVFDNSFELPLLIAEKKPYSSQIVAYPQEHPSLWTSERLKNLLEQL